MWGSGECVQARRAARVELQICEREWSFWRGAHGRAGLKSKTKSVIKRGRHSGGVARGEAGGES